MKPHVRGALWPASQPASRPADPPNQLPARKSSVKLRTFQVHDSMSNLVNLRKYKQKRAEGKTLCASGFHKWEALERGFDVKQGRLVTAERCKRCGAQRTRAT